MASGNREDYLINILRLTENENTSVRTSKLASYMDVAPASVTEMIKILHDAGYVDYQRYKGVTLTDSGREYAKNLRRKHHIMERFLTEMLDVDCKMAHEEACRMEHSVSDDSANKICRFIGTKIDNDCDTCNNPCDRGCGSSTLVNLEPGIATTISHLHGDSSSKVKKLLSMGFIPGREVIVNSRLSNGLCVVNLGDAVVAIDESLASAVCVDEKK